MSGENSLNLDGNYIELNPVQFWNAFSPTHEPRFLSNRTELRFVQFLNIPFPSSFEFTKPTSVSLSHSRNMSSPR